MLDVQSKHFIPRSNASGVFDRWKQFSLFNKSTGLGFFLNTDFIFFSCYNTTIEAFHEKYEKALLIHCYKERAVTFPYKSYLKTFMGRYGLDTLSACHSLLEERLSALLNREIQVSHLEFRPWNTSV